MEKTDAGTSVGVDDPYEHIDRCDHLTDEGRCRFAVEHGDRDPQFARRLRERDYRCPVAGERREEGLTGPWDWVDCAHFRCRDRDRACARCGLEEERMAHDDERPLLEEHHLSYRDGAGDGTGGATHEITVYLCRWCHAKVHDSWARIDDDAGLDSEAIAERERRRGKQQSEMGFETAAERFETGDE